MNDGEFSKGFSELCFLSGNSLRSPFSSNPMMIILFEEYCIEFLVEIGKLGIQFPTAGHLFFRERGRIFEVSKLSERMGPAESVSFKNILVCPVVIRDPYLSTDRRIIRFSSELDGISFTSGSPEQKKHFTAGVNSGLEPSIVSLLFPSHIPRGFIVVNHCLSFETFFYGCILWNHFRLLLGEYIGNLSVGEINADHVGKKLLNLCVRLVLDDGCVADESTDILSNGNHLLGNRSGSLAFPTTGTVPGLNEMFGDTMEE